MTSIEWTDETWNPVRGCSRVSPGCDHCYAMGQAHRFSGEGQPYAGLTVLRPKTAKRPGVDWSGRAVFVPGQLAVPLSWRKPRRIFVNSMSDLFHESLSNEQIAAVFGVMAACPQHTFQVLTKRPERAAKWFAWVQERQISRVIGAQSPSMTCKSIATDVLGTVPDSGYGPWADCGLDVREDMNDPLCFKARAWPLSNVWLGVSAEDQQRADERIPLLLECPAAIRFVSAEPLLGPVDFGEWLPALDWVIVGGESGPGARPFRLRWARDVVAQCRAAGISAFVKQIGSCPVISEKTWRSHPTRFALLSPRSEDPALKEQGLVQLAIQHSKGGDPTEWPAGLNVREFPEATR